MTADDCALIAVLRARPPEPWCTLCDDSNVHHDGSFCPCGPPPDDRRDLIRDLCDLAEREAARVDELAALLEEARALAALSQTFAVERNRAWTALDLVSGALCDAGDVPVPDDPARYGEAVRKIARERDALREGR